MLAGVDAEIEGDPGVEIGGLAYDSRHAGPGVLFFCVPGARVDGHDFAPAAVEAGCPALVVERRLGLGSTEALVADARAAMAPAAATFNGDPTARAAGGRHHRHQRQDDDGVPDPAPARGWAACARACWGR